MTSCTTVTRDCIPESHRTGCLRLANSQHNRQSRKLTETQQVHPEHVEGGIIMLKYERHLIFVTVIAAIIIAAAVLAIVFEVRLPFVGGN